MKRFNFTAEPSEAHKQLIMRKGEFFEGLCPDGQIEFQVNASSQMWEPQDKQGTVFFERPEILDEARIMFLHLKTKWSDKIGFYSEEKLMRWLAENAEELEPEEYYDDCDDLSTAYAFYVETALAMYALIVDLGEMQGAYPTLSIFAEDRRYLGQEQDARKHLEEAADQPGNIAYAREACYYLLAQLPDSEKKIKRKLSRTIDSLNMILRG